jgi:hypothetical protein
MTAAAGAVDAFGLVGTHGGSLPWRAVNRPSALELQLRSALALDELGAAARALKKGRAQVAHVEGVTDACHEAIADALAAVHAAVAHLRGTGYYAKQ